MLHLINLSILGPVFVVLFLAYSSNEWARATSTTDRGTGLLRKWLSARFLSAGLAAVIMTFLVVRSAAASQVLWAEWVISLSLWGQLVAVLRLALDPLSSVDSEPTRSTLL